MTPRQKIPYFEPDLDHPINNRLVQWHPMDENGGRVIRNIARVLQHPNANPSGFANMTGANWVASPYGPALTFNGVDENILLAAVNQKGIQPISSSWTLSVIANPATTQNGVIYSIRSVGAFDGILAMQVAGDINGTVTGNKIRVVRANANQSDIRESLTDADVADGNWHHIVAVGSRSTDRIEIYVDGEPQSITTDNAGGWPSNELTNNTGFKIGSLSNNVNYYTGEISDVRFWHRELAPDEIASLYVDPYSQFQIKRSVPLQMFASWYYRNIVLDRKRFA